VTALASARRGTSALTLGNIMKIRGTDFVLFSVSDLDKAVEFYRDILNLPCEVYSKDEWAEFNCGNVTLSLDPDSIKKGEKGMGRIALSVEDVGVAYKEMKEKGADLVGEPADYGCCQAIQVRDPDGNHVILHHRADGTFGQQEP